MDKRYKIHYKAPRNPNRTACGHDSTIPGRTFANVTTDKTKVTCAGCNDNIKKDKNINKRRKKF